MAAIVGTSTGYEGEVNTVAWGQHAIGFGERYWVESIDAAQVSVVPAVARTVRVAPGRIGGHNIVDNLTGAVDIVLPNPASGTVYYLVVARRYWETSNETTIQYVTGTAVRTLPSRTADPGLTYDEQPLALVPVTKDVATPGAPIDLRVIGTKGRYEAFDNLVLDYMDQPGTVVRIGGTVYECRVDGSWETVSTPVQKLTGLAATEEPGANWFRTGSAELVRDAGRRTLFFEAVRGSGNPITATSSGGIADSAMARLLAADRPNHVVPAAAYVQTAGTGSTYFAGAHITPAGYIELNSFAPGATIGGEGQSWSVRLSATWYVA